MTITLEHEVYCAKVGRCVCSSRDVVRERLVEVGGPLVPRVESLRIPKSINIAPKGESEPLHEAARECTDIRNGTVNRPQKFKILPV